MAKSEENELGSKLTRREFLGTSLKVGLGAVGVAVAGVGCGPGATTPQAAPATPTPQPAAPTAAPAQPAVVEFWQIAQGPNFAEVMAEAIKEFEEIHSNIRVNLNEQPTDDLRTKMRPVFTDGGPGPDVVYEGSVQTLTYGRMPYGFLDIIDRVEAIKDKTPAAVWAPLEETGSSFGIPFCAFPFFLVYNKDLYEAAGVAGLPGTWDDLLEVNRKVHDPSKDTFGFLQPTNKAVTWLLENLWYDSGVGYFEGAEDFRQYDISKPLTIAESEAVAALEYVRSLAETAPGGIQGNLGIDNAREQFAQGNIGHFFAHTIRVSQIPGHNPAMVPQQNFDVMVFPKGPGRRGLPFSTSVLGVTKLSKDPDAAWEFVRFLSDTWEGRLAPSIGTVPVRRDVEVDEDAGGSWLVPIGRESLAGDAFPQAFFPQLEAIRLPLIDNVQAYFLDQKTALQALEDTVAEAEKALTG